MGRSDVVAQVLATLASAARHRAYRVLLRAPLGGGRSRLLDELADAIVTRGGNIRRIHASAAVQSIPFGAVAHMLPVGARETDDPVTIIGALRDILAPVGVSTPIAVIDDLPWLDVATAGVIASLATSNEVLLVGSARTGEPLPPPLVEVFLGGRSLVIDLPAMTDADIANLLQVVLGGPVDGAVVVSLRERSDGNPLFVRELVRGALEEGSLHEVGGMWRLRGELPRSSRLRDVVESRLEVITPEERRAMELLAACDSVEIDELEDLVGLEPLSELEARGLITTVQRHGRLTAALSHPLHAEAIRVGLPAVRTRMLMRQQVIWLEEHPESRNGDPLQRAIWRLDAGLPTDIDQLLQGAQLAAALQDSRSVLRLARPALEAKPAAATAGMVADALFQTGQWAEAYVVLDLATSLQPSPALRVDLGTTRSTIQLWGLGDEAGALAVLDGLRADPEMTSSELLRLSAEYASVLVYAGRPAEARAELETATSSGEVRTQLGAAVSLSNSLAMAGRTSAALAVIDDALAKRAGHSLLGIADVDTHYVAKAFALLEAGDLQAALDVAVDGYERAVTNTRPLSQYWFSLLVARVHLLRGEALTSLRDFVSARALGVDAGLSGPTRTALVGVVIAHALLGDSVAAARALAELNDLPAFGFMAPELGLAEAWCAVANGDTGTARRVLLTRGAEAVETGHLTSAVWLLHDAARLGAATEVLELITDLAQATDSALAVARSAHVAALVADDLPAMIASAEQFESLGMHLIAAEALVTAGGLARVAGDDRLVRSLGSRAAHHIALCEGATTPALIAHVRFVEPLTEREREVAFLAANGMKSREIAEQLFVSLRTVSNHLQHVYDKLGVRGRDELRSALSPGE
ncbi:MAG: LuxR C-terminal-related transcriptional regulator [Ilumatobacteraceae bacterium]